MRILAAICSPVWLALAVLWLLLLGMEKMHPCCFLHDDNATWFIGSYVHDFRVLTETGRVAEVNYFQHGGEPFIEQGQTAVLYPPIYLAVALAKWVSGDLRWSLEWVAAVHLTIGLVGFYFWLRQGGIKPWIAALGALAWALNPFVLIVGASWIFMTIIGAWLPWLFWALDRLLARPSFRSALFLGVISGLFFLQGYVQMFAYAFLFLALYALFQFATRPETRKAAVLFHLAVSVLIFAILAPPLLLPMLSAVDDSAMRASPIPMDAALFYSVELSTFFPTQICHFASNLVFGVSTVILYCPALFILPVTAFRFYYGSAGIWRRLLPLVFLGVVAFIFSTDGHALLSELPVFDKFRWPFKVFIFVDFFLLTSFIWTAASWTETRSFSPLLSSITAIVCVGLITFANGAVAIAFHSDNTFSRTILPAGVNPLVPGMDPTRGRVATFADGLSESRSSYYLTHAYATYYSFPSIGGYNPLVGLRELEFSLYLDFPNVCTGTLTPDFQKLFESRAVRYWIVDPSSTHYPEAERLPHMRVMESTPDRVVFEDMEAPPLVYSDTDPTSPCALSYSGNSILIPLAGVTAPVEVSLGPTQGWWYRVDHGPWHQTLYQDGRLQIDFDSSAQLLEVSYFDPGFHEGLIVSAFFLVLGLFLYVRGSRSTPT